ncbi:hypothetical protein NUW54_g11717 [Trametes sanguinea]|uniref:Uncharacterized protein n=1 Tax=Trametes sanguinea TaxID=158606 RepID=A0ACC1N8X7_9APHY|nr:hypothetical protein NUW54_g11717 [Trametes sanguinea]
MGLSPPAADSQALELSFVRSPPQPKNIVLSSISCGGLILDEVPVLDHWSGLNAWFSNADRVYIPFQQGIMLYCAFTVTPFPSSRDTLSMCPDSSVIGASCNRAALRIQRMCGDTRSGTGTRARIYSGLVNWRCALAIRFKTFRSHSGGKQECSLATALGHLTRGALSLLVLANSLAHLDYQSRRLGRRLRHQSRRDALTESICEISGRTNSGHVHLSAAVAAVAVVHARACPDQGGMGAAIPHLMQLALSLPPILPYPQDEIHTEVTTGTVEVQDELIPDDEDEDVSYRTRGKSTVSVVIRVGDGVDERPAAAAAAAAKGSRRKNNLGRAPAGSSSGGRLKGGPAVPEQVVYREDEMDET